MKKRILICVLIIALFAGCSGKDTVYNYKLPKETGANDLTPEITGYTKYDATETVAEITTLAGTSGQASLNPYLGIAGTTAKFAACMQKKGAAVEVGYHNVTSNENNELNIGFAAVGIGDKKQMTDFGNLASCLGASVDPLALKSGPVMPCEERFTIKSDTNEFYVLIVGVFDQTSGDSCQKVKDAMLANAKTLEK